MSLGNKIREIRKNNDLTQEQFAQKLSVLAENQYFATFILIPAGICLIGSVVGFLIAKKVK